MNNKTDRELKSYEERRLDLLKVRKTVFPFLVLLPISVLLITLLLSRFPPIVIGGTAISILLSTLLYHFKVGRHFQVLKAQARLSLIEEFMKTYHPDVTFSYFPNKQNVKHILDEVQLVNADNYKEEDVLSGRYKGAGFYFSEIDLESEHSDSEGHTRTSTIFKGILFKLKIPGRNFPKTRIQSKRKFLQVLFGEFIEDIEHDFWYETENARKYQSTMKELLPFIAHLKTNQGDIRLQAEGDELVLMMESNMKFLDDPKQKINEPLDRTEYKRNIAKQLNTLLFIVDAMINNLDSSEIEERLELKALEPISYPSNVKQDPRLR